jgi:hypothetical protein
LRIFPLFIFFFNFSSQELLIQIYERIRTNKLKLNEDDNDMTSAFMFRDHQGWLKKEGGKVRAIKRRWFILTSNCLYYFTDPQNTRLLGTIPLIDVDVLPMQAETKHGFGLMLLSKIPGAKIKSNKKGPKGVEVGSHDSFVFFAETNDDRTRWITRIKVASQSSPPPTTTAIANTNTSALAAVGTSHSTLGNSSQQLAGTSTTVSSDNAEDSENENENDNDTAASSTTDIRNTFKNNFVTTNPAAAPSPTVIASIALSSFAESTAVLSLHNAIPTIQIRDGISADVVSRMTAVDVEMWLESQGMGDRRNHFREQRIDGPALMWLCACSNQNQEAFLAVAEQRLGFKTSGEAMRLGTQLNQLVNNNSSPNSNDNTISMPL